MGTNTKIYLPYHVKTKQVFDVIQKVMGAEFIQETFDKQINRGRETIKTKVPFDGNAPANESNPWHLTLSAITKAINTIEAADIDMFKFNFTDIAGNHFHCLYFTEIEETGMKPGEKLMNPNVSATWCIIGKRLVDFFGGRMLYSDSSDEDLPESWYHATKVKYPIKQENQSGSDRWYQYQNALFNEPIINSHELKDMNTICSFYERDEKLFNFLLKFEHLQKLEKEMPEKNSSGTKSNLKL